MSYDLLMVEPAGRADEGWFSMASGNMAAVRGAMTDLGMLVPGADDVDAWGETALPVGIPVHKLSDNGGWRVTPREISAALLAYSMASHTDRATARGVYGRWDEWVLFLVDACETGGFRVE
ncbi:hypothetical protein B4N89_27620 [Embleya scabrispora]|uniref:Uncharacterized protein n=1 Tax=Embleya scabrispora TaxID=159449 RepID=A0A1T3P559_9ACTN|nr:hypothetical protein [Embleya scabrispora]OPC84194.1 hypothetical protein B4N89_27620 [Embleya scabrispora]